MKAITDALLRIGKAIVGGAGAGGALYLQLSEGGMTTTEWEQVVGSVIVVGFLTWLIPNKPAVATAPAPKAVVPGP